MKNGGFWQGQTTAWLGMAMIMFGALYVPGSQAATAANESPRRVSIAISGGASLGAYEGGLNWGVLRSLATLDHNAAGLGTGVRRVEAASFAGASAGGINAVITATLWCVRPEADGGPPNRIDDNVFRTLWMLPDVNNLLPPRADSPLYDEGDALFSRSSLRRAGGILLSLWDRPVYRAGCRVPVGITVTRLLPELLHVGDVEIQNQRFFLPFEVHTRSDGRAGFSFNPADYPGVVDPAMILLPRAPADPAFSIAPGLIVETMFTSSSVPLAFGRRHLRYCRLKSANLAAERSAAPDTMNVPVSGPDASVCPDGYEPAAADFVDGGLFDNLPIGVARTLAERHRNAADNPLPVMYVYLEPDRTRYPVPASTGGSACQQRDPPPACRKLDFGFTSEGQLLLGAFGSARKYELYRELTSEYWTSGIPELALSAAQTLEEGGKRIDCRGLLEVFHGTTRCADRLREAARLLELSYGRERVPIRTPFSAARLETAGLAQACRTTASSTAAHADCRVDSRQLRLTLADAIATMLRRAGLVNDPLMPRVQRGRLEMTSDRSLRVSSRGAPVTGFLLGQLGAFLDRKFREYDYYVGVYDALVSVSDTMCRLHYSFDRSDPAYPDCLDETARRLYATLGVEDDARGRYVLALLAWDEFGANQRLRFAYQPMPAVDRDMRIIHEGLHRTLAAGELAAQTGPGLFFTEKQFFKHLRDQGFLPTPTADGREPLLVQIMTNPDAWTSEVTQRLTSRFMALETAARDIYAQREPDETKREMSLVGLLGATSHVLRSATYTYPGFDGAPSTAPADWFWRHVIPYEMALDGVAGDVLLTWQPTWSLSPRTTLAARTSLGVPGGFLGSRVVDRSNYLALGLDATRQTGNQLWSSWGAMVGGYHNLDPPATGSQNSAGFDLHAGFFRDRVRIGVGTRDIREFGDNWFLQFGVADLPGLGYWLTR